MNRKTLTLLVMAVSFVAASSLATAATKPASKSATARSAPAAKPGATPAVVDSVGLLERAVARDSSKWENLYRLGVMYLDRDRSQEALKVFQKANQVRPHHAPTLVNLGAAYDALGAPLLAQDTYRRALEAAPGDTIATCRLASSLYSVTKYADAMKLLRDLIAKNPRAYCAYFTLGVAFADAGIYKDAIRAWQKVVEIAPDSPEAMSAKESIGVLERVVQMKSTP